MAKPGLALNAALDDLLGKKVRVWSNSGDDKHTDDGILEVFDYPWLRIRLDENSVMCFPVHNVRLVTCLEPAKARYPSPSEVLLRPSETK